MSNEATKSNHNEGLTMSQKIIGALIAVVFIGVMVLVLTEGTKKSVALTINGEPEEVRTHATTVEDVLAEQNIELQKEDLITPAADTKITNGLAVNYVAAQEVAVTVDGEQTKVMTAKQKVSQILNDLAVEVTEHDEVKPGLEESVTDEIVVNKAFEVTVLDGTQEKKVWTTKQTVQELLARESIELNELDKLEGLEMSTVLEPNHIVSIARIVKSEEVVETPKNFEVEEKKDSTLAKGKTKVLKEGKKGTIVKKYEVVVKNGKEVERKVISEEVVTQPQSKVVAVGTKEAVQVAQSSKANNKVTVSRDNAAPTGGKEYYVEATAYTPYCTGCSGISAAGINLRANPNLKLIAVDPRKIPLGTKVWVEGYGYAIAGDTGGAIKGNRIDVLMQTKQQAYSWGRKRVKIKVMN